MKKRLVKGGSIWITYDCLLPTLDGGDTWEILSVGQAWGPKEKIWLHRTDGRGTAGHNWRNFQRIGQLLLITWHGRRAGGGRGGQEQISTWLHTHTGGSLPPQHLLRLVAHQKWWATQWGDWGKLDMAGAVDRSCSDNRSVLRRHGGKYREARQTRKI